MKDLIAKLQIDANCALGAIWMHIDAQAARIAELEAQIAGASAPVVGKVQPLLYVRQRDIDGSFVGDLVYAYKSASEDWNIPYCAAPMIAGADKLRDAILALPLPDTSCRDIEKEDLTDLLKAAADLAASTALQAPVREVPGYKLVPLEVTDAMLEAWKNELCIPVGSSPEAKARRAYKAMLAAAPLPAAPVQKEGE